MDGGKQGKVSDKTEDTDEYVTELKELSST